MPVLIVALVAVLLLLRREMIRRRDEMHEEELRTQLWNQIQTDKRNYGAYEQLGNSLLRSGKLREARATYLAALEVVGKDTISRPLEYKIAQIDADLATQSAQRIGQFKPTTSHSHPELVICRKCGASNTPDCDTCTICNALLARATFKEALLHPNTWRGALESAAMLLVVCIFVQVVNWLPFDIKGLVIGCTIVVAIVRLFQSIDGARQ